MAHEAAGTNISGATASAYLLTASEVGAVITCAVTATNSAGSPSATSSGTAAVTAAAGWTPASLSGLLAWYKGDTLTGSNSDPIATWPDGSGNASDATQATGGARPTLVTANLNGKNVVRFTAANSQYFDLPNVFSEASAGSIFMVIKKTADPASGGDLGIHRIGNSTGGSNSGHMPYLDGNIYSEFGTDTRKTAGNPTPSLASWRIIGIHSAASDCGFYIDGGVYTAGVGAPFYSTASNTVGFDSAPKFGRSVRDPTGSPYLYYMDGWTAEIVLTNAKLGATDRQKLEGFLAHKWGLTGNLDAGHPYRSSPP